MVTVPDKEVNGMASLQGDEKRPHTIRHYGRAIKNFISIVLDVLFPC